MSWWWSKTMRFFKPRRLCIAAILLAGVGVCWWVMYEPAPVIKLEALKTKEGVAFAEFRLENPSNTSYQFDEYATGQPVTIWSRWDGSKWEDPTEMEPGPYFSGIGPKPRLLEPRSGFTRKCVFLPHPFVPGDRVKLAITFQRQPDADAKSSAPPQDGFIARFLNWLGVRRSGPIIVWSDVVVVE
jgi:hypothetical protein